MKFIDKIKSASTKIADKTKNLFNKIIEKIIFFINKDNFTKTKLILVAFASLAFAVICEYTIFRIWYPQFISKNRMMLVSIIYMFIGIHFVFKLSNMYEFIHKHRYKIACAFLLFVMIGQYSGSSITNYNYYENAVITDVQFDDSYELANVKLTVGSKTIKFTMDALEAAQMYGQKYNILYNTLKKEIESSEKTDKNVTTT